MSKKKKLSEISQAHGKIESVQPTYLDQIWGDIGTSKYKTLDESEYLKFINDLPKSDLMSHAASIGIMPIDNRDSLTQRLIKEFRKHTSAYTVPITKKTVPNLSSEASKILKEGK
jgi:hypothetical protein